MRSRYEYDVAAQESYYRHPHRFRVEPFRILGNLYFVGDRDAGIHLIHTEEGLILIDTGYPTASALLVQSIWQLGFRPGDIRYILHTHGHFDHFGGTALLTALSGAKTFLGAEDAGMFRENPALTLSHLCGYAHTELFDPDAELGDGDVIRLGGTAVRAVATPGHSDGAMSFFFRVHEEGKSYVAGLQGGAGLHTMRRSFVEEHGNTRCREQFRASMRRIRNEPVDIVLGNHTGHNHTLEKRQAMLRSPGGPNPFVDPLEWPGLIDRFVEALDRMEGEEAAGTDLVPDSDGRS